MSDRQIEGSRTDFLFIVTNAFNEYKYSKKAQSLHGM